MFLNGLVHLLQGKRLNMFLEIFQVACLQSVNVVIDFISQSLGIGGGILGGVFRKEFFDQFKNKSGSVKKIAFKLGQEMGKVLKLKHNIQGEDINAVAEILRVATGMEEGEHSIIVKDDQVTMQNIGLCPVTNAVQKIDLNWEWLDTNFAWPWLEGIVSLIRPDIKMNINKARCKGDSVCMHIFEVR